MARTLESARETLERRWGFKDFRPQQLPIIESVYLRKQDTLAILPTGSGKSVTFQVPAIKFKGTTIVFSPLIALMQDQVTQLKANGVRGEFLSSLQTQEEQDAVMKRFRKGKLKLLYIAPERLKVREFREAVRHVKIPLIVIDEAHTSVIWNRTFRSSFSYIPHFIRKFGKDSVIMAVTATADPKVQKGIIQHMARTLVKSIVVSPVRENLQYLTMAHQEDPVILGIVHAHLREQGGSAIVYAGSRRNCEDLALLNRQLNSYEGLPYHAGLPKGDRKRVQEWFMAPGEPKVVFTTKAFGMGIDKSDIRMVMHYYVPGNFYEMIQEQGRAGRDGKPALCVTHLHNKSRGFNQFFVRMQNPPHWMYRRLWEVFARRGRVGDQFVISDRDVREILNPKIGGSEMAALSYMESCGLISMVNLASKFYYVVKQREEFLAHFRNAASISFSRTYPNKAMVTLAPGDEEMTRMLPWSVAEEESGRSKIELGIVRNRDRFDITEVDLEEKMREDMEELKYPWMFAGIASQEERLGMIDKMFTAVPAETENESLTNVVPGIEMEAT